MYEDTFKIGQTIRSYDFEGRQDCYVEGEIIATHKDCTVAPYYAYELKVTKRVFAGEDTTAEDADELNVFAPMITSFDYEGRLELIPVTRDHLIDLSDRLIVDFADLSKDEPEHIDSPRPIDRCFRVYKSSPEGATIQIRHVTRLAGKNAFASRGAKKRRLTASVAYVGVEQLDEIIEALVSVRNDIKGRAHAE